MIRKGGTKWATKISEMIPLVLDRKTNFSRVRDHVTIRNIVL